jgi:hypothetical protein
MSRCAVEGCNGLGAVKRVFAHYVMTLCPSHWVEALINHNIRREP